MLTDLRLAFRQLAKSPGFTCTAVLTLALGIGACTAIFSVLHAVLLRPLPYRDPARLVTVMQRTGAETPADFHEMQAGTQSFRHLAAALGDGVVLTGADRPEDIRSLRVTEAMFDLLGVPPQLGRTFRAADFADGAAPTVVISHALWQRRFGGTPDVIGRTIMLSGEAATIIGVMPPEFRFAPFWITNAEMWTRLRIDPANRDMRALRVFGRLKDGVTQEQAQAEMTAFAQRQAVAFPSTHANRTIEVDLLHERAVGNIRPALLMLGGAVSLVLLIVCTNLAGLLLVRAAGRQRELAVCTALGASRARLVRRQLAECLWLAAAGGVGAVATAYSGLGLLTGSLANLSGRFAVPRLHEITPDATLLLVAVALAFVTTLAFGLLPAWQSSRTDLNAALRDGGRGMAGGGRGARTRSLLIVAEVAVALVLLAGAGLFLRGFAKLSHTDPGFRSDGALTFTVSTMGRPDYVGAPREQLYREILRRLEALPGVTAVGAVNHLPLVGDTWGFRLWAEGAPIPDDGKEMSVVFRASWPGYFKALGARLVQGRDFTERDDAQAEGVVLVNEVLARRLWPEGSAVGQRISLADPRQTPRWLTVVGVVADVKQESWAEPARPEIYRPILQQRAWFFDSTGSAFSYLSFVVRTSGEPAALANSVRETVWSLDRELPISNVATLDQVAAAAVAQPRLQLLLVGLFAVTSLALAALGLYGVMAYAVAQRTTELGVRLALGAQRGDVLRLVLRSGLRLALGGAVIGLIVALSVTRSVASLLHGVSPFDPVALGGSTALLLAVAVVATLIPAWRASRVDPLVALRSE
jgi:predicted permease